jgi:hypothetical protein
VPTSPRDLAIEWFRDSTAFELMASAGVVNERVIEHGLFGVLSPN